MADFKKFEEWLGRIGFGLKDDKNFTRHAFVIGDSEAEVKELIKIRIAQLKRYEPNEIRNVAISHKIITKTYMTIDEFEELP